MTKPPEWRNTMLLIRTEWELLNITDIDTFGVSPVSFHADRIPDPVKAAKFQWVLTGRARPSGDPQAMLSSKHIGLRLLCYFYTDEAAQQALDLVMEKFASNGRVILDMRELIAEGRPELDEDIGKEQRVINMDGGNPTAVRSSAPMPSPDWLPQQDQYGPAIQPMIPPADNDDLRRMLTSAITQQANRNGDIFSAEARAQARDQLMDAQRQLQRNAGILPPRSISESAYQQAIRTLRDPNTSENARDTALQALGLLEQPAGPTGPTGGPGPSGPRGISWGVSWEAEQRAINAERDMQAQLDAQLRGEMEQIASETEAREASLTSEQQNELAEAEAEAVMDGAGRPTDHPRGLV